MRHLFILTLILYFLGMGKYFLYLFFRRKPLFVVANILIVVAFVLHTGILFIRSSHTGHGPYTNPFEYLTFFAWCVVLAYLIAEAKFRILDLGSFVIPLAFLLLTIAYFLPWQETPILSPKEFWLTVHRTSSFLGYSAITLTFAVGIMFLLQEGELKSKHFGLI